MKQKFLLTAAGLAFFTLSAQADIVAHYKFDEPVDSLSAEDSVGDASGAIGDNIVLGVSGIVGSAYYFPGAAATQGDVVNFGNASFFPQIVASGQLTFSAWINTTDVTGNRNTVVFAGDDRVNNSFTDMGVAAGQVNFPGQPTARNRPSTTPGSHPQTTGIYGKTIVNDGQWHHLAMTVNLATAALTIFVDGVQTETYTMVYPAFPNYNRFEIGRLARRNNNNLAPVDPFQGMVDDVQIYSRALTPGEVQFLFENPGEIALPPEPQVDLAIQSSVIDGNDFRITFTGAPSTTYNLRGSLDLQAFDIDLGTVSTDENGAGTATTPLVEGRTKQFYRIEEIPAL